MKISLYSNTPDGWTYFESLGFQKTHQGKCVGCIADVSEDKLWEMVKDFFSKGYAVKIYRPKSKSEVDVIVMIDDNKWHFRQR